MPPSAYTVRECSSLTGFTLAKVAWQAEKGKLAPDKEFYYETGVEFVKMDVEHKMLMIQYIHSRLKKEN